MKAHIPLTSNEIDTILDELDENERKQQINENGKSHIIIDVHLFDEVLLTDKSKGIVKFIGEIKGKNGLFFGIDITKGKGINNGCIKNKRYFRTKNNQKTGRFTQISKIMKRSKTAKSIPFTIGDTIQCPQLNTTAIIKYIGIPAFSKSMKTVYFGIELAEPKGDCNGEIYSSYLGAKISYFQCQKKHGLYVKSTEVSITYISAEKQEKKEVHHVNVQNEYEWSEILQHNTRKDLWLVWHNKVYDLTRFLSYHPGGIDVILQIAQKSQDITKPLKMLNHPPITDNILLKHYIGNVKDSNSLNRTVAAWKQMDCIWDSKNKTLSGKRMVNNIMNETEALITWSDVFSVHIDILDKQHENLANLINALHKTYQLKDIVELLHRWDVHCKTEETLFHYYGFDESLSDPHNIDHREIYHKIKDTITDLRIKYDNNKPQCEELILFAKAASQIFKKHHFEFDSQYVKHLDNINVKMFE